MKVPWVDEVELSSSHIVELLIQIRDSCTQIGPKSLEKLRVPIVEVRREKNIFVRIMGKLLKRTTNTYQIPKELKRTMNLFLFQLRRSNYSLKTRTLISFLMIIPTLISFSLFSSLRTRLDDSLSFIEWTGLQR